LAGILRLPGWTLDDECAGNWEGDSDCGPNGSRVARVQVALKLWHTYL